MNLGEPPVLPSLTLPEPIKLPRPVLEVPSVELPRYKPLTVPPSDLRPPPGIKGKPIEGKTSSPQQTPSSSPEVKYIKLPVLDKEIPVPSQEILVTAVSTATVSVAATLTATAVFKQLVSVFKPLIKTAWTKITKKKDLSNSSSSSGPQDS